MDDDKEEEYRPVIIEVLEAYLIAFALLYAAVYVLFVFLLPFPASVTGPLTWLVALLIGIFFALRALSAFWVRLTQLYAVGDGYLRIQRGWVSKTSAQVPFRNIAEVKAVLPLLLRVFGVGLIVISTNDGYRHVLYNLKDPGGIAERVRPSSSPVITRPSVG